MYEIQVDRAHSVVEATLSGMMTIDEVDAYVADLKRAFVVNRLHGYAMVIDVTRCPIQQQDMVQAMGAHMATMPKARALAIVVGSSLARMQVRRLFNQPYARIVATIDEGRAWVVSGVEPDDPRSAAPGDLGHGRSDTASAMSGPLRDFLKETREVGSSPAILPSGRISPACGADAASSGRSI